jgi:long-chain acyl-CoA synthetase
MKGYRNNPEANAEVFFYGKSDGLKYFRTGEKLFKLFKNIRTRAFTNLFCMSCVGDLGRFVDGRFLKITGRIKEQYKLENGKYVVPGPLEDSICRSHYIQQVLLFGDNKPFNVVLVVPDFVALRQWVAQHMSAVPFSGSSPENDCKMIQLKEVQDLLSMEVRMNALNSN